MNQQTIKELAILTINKEVINLQIRMNKVATDLNNINKSLLKASINVAIEEIMNLTDEMDKIKESIDLLKDK